MLTSTMAMSGATTAATAMTAPMAIQIWDITPPFRGAGLRPAVRLADISSFCRALELYSPSLSV
jgi:hypothetical protein